MITNRIANQLKDVQNEKLYYCRCRDLYAQHFCLC